MIIKCKENNIKIISIEKIGLSESQDTDYSFLKIKKEYIVYGIYHTSDSICFLIDIENCKPMWVPSFLFFMIENSIPDSWSFNMIKDNENYNELYSFFGIFSLLGYNELVNNYDHYIGILERDHKELHKFALLKEEHTQPLN